MFLKKLKSERGSITIFVLSAMLLVAGIIFVSYFSMMNKSASQAAELNKIQEEYNQSNAEMAQIYEESKTFVAGEIAEDNEEYTDTNGNTATIPAGFKIVSGNEKIADGLVIQDTDGNEFVWIPVETVVSDTEENGTNNKAMAIKDGNNYKGLLYSFSESGSTVISGCTTSTDSYHEPDMLTDYDNDTSYNNGLFTKDSLQQEYNKMIESVEKYHGFYVSRYELGLEGTTPVSKNASTNANVTTADSSNSGLKNWYGLYRKCKEFAPQSSNKSVVSSMIWGSQFDAMMNWMQEQGIEDVASGNVNPTNITQVTGSNSEDVIKNIYDLHGCHDDWTLEANSSNYRVARGGYDYVQAFPLSHRSNLVYSSDESSDNSTRLTLYIK